MNNELRIQDVVVGDDHPPVVIAEIGINHGGSLDLAKVMVESAIQNGARLIKHQTHIPPMEMSVEAERAIPGNSTKSIFRIMQECALSEDEEHELAAFTRSLGGIFFSTPFSREAVDRLLRIGVPAFKIGSGECNNYPLVEYIASKGLPVILSTGMNTVSSVATSVEILRSKAIPFALMHTTNLYPTPQRLLRLGALAEMSAAFPDAVMGLSDHSISNAACLGSVSLGARLLERHYTDSKDREGPDIVCSMDGRELRELISFSRQIFEALGGTKGPAEEEAVTINFAFSSVASLRDIEQGEVLTTDNIFPLRPAGGAYGPTDYPRLLGLRAARRIAGRTQLSPEDLVEN